MKSGLSILILVLVVATAFGLYRRSTDGRLRHVKPAAPLGAPTPVADDAPPVDLDVDNDPDDRLSAADLDTPLGERATLVQFSTAFCQPCRATRRILDEVAQMVDGVTHVEVDAEAHLDLVRRLNVLRTPTVFVLDRSGRVVRRASGAPRKADVIAALGALI